MCVSSAPAQFSQTIVYLGTAERDGSTVHVAGYENTARDRTRRLWQRRRSGNAMLLHFPAVAGTMTAVNLVDTEPCPHVLIDMARQVLRPTVVGGYVAGSAPASVEVFDSGIYTIVLASDPGAIPDVLEQVPSQKRPAIDESLLAWYGETFPGWPVALCCFDNRSARHAAPMLWWYQPLFPDLLFAPGIDSHTGGVPDLDQLVAVDHQVIVGVDNPEIGETLRHRDGLPGEVRTLLPTHAFGANLARARLPNGDFVVDLEKARAGRPQIERRVLTA